MNFGLIIGVSKYSNLQDLPGCENDVSAVSKLLELTKKYDKVAIINKNEPAAKVKEQIITFFEECKGKETDEFLFYYTGHGEYIDDNFFYLLSDYESRRRNSTSFQNDFIDNLIRTVSPKLTVKIIDACQSGESYIKSNETVKAYFKSTAGKLANCYFLNSSHNDQSSWLRKFSSFTQAFLESIRDSQTNEVRYLSIIDHITDYFERNPEQTPFYITQGSFTEKFCQLNEELRKFLDQTLGSGNTSSNNKGSYIDIILEQGKKFLKKEDVELFIKQTKDLFQDYIFEDELSQIYKVNVEYLDNMEDYQMDFKPIGTWLSKNPDKFFAKPLYEAKRIPIHREDGTISNSLRKVITGYSNTVDLESEGIAFIFDPEVGNIPSYDLTYMFVVSKTEIRLFKSFTPYKETGWDQKELDADLKWRMLVISKEDLANLESFWRNEIAQTLEELKNILKKQVETESIEVEKTSSLLETPAS